MRVVVIGGGISGVLVARQLCLAGHQVVLLEAHHVGAGSSSRTAAGIRQQFTSVATVRAMRFAVATYQQLGGELGSPCLVPSGYLFLADEAGVAAGRARVAMQRAAGLDDVSWLDAHSLRAAFPWVGPDVAGGSWCPSDGFLHPAVIYGEGARRVVALGGDVRTRAPVLGARHVGGRLVAVRTPDGHVEGDVFVDATNAWSPRTERMLGATPLPVAAHKRHLWFLRRGEAVPADVFAGMPLVVSPAGAYGRPENAETLLLGKAQPTHDEVGFGDEDQDRVAPGCGHTDGVDALPYVAWGELAEVVPALGGCEGFIATTAGYYGVTPDHSPFLDVDPGVPNLVRAVGFSGHGAMFGPFTAAVVTALVEAGRSLPAVSLPTGDVSLDAFRIGRVFAEPEGLVI